MKRAKRHYWGTVDPNRENFDLMRSQGLSYPE